MGAGFTVPAGHLKKTSSIILSRLQLDGLPVFLEKVYTIDCCSWENCPKETLGGNSLKKLKKVLVTDIFVADFM